MEPEFWFRVRYSRYSTFYNQLFLALYSSEFSTDFEKWYTKMTAMTWWWLLSNQNYDTGYGTRVAVHYVIFIFKFRVSRQNFSKKEAWSWIRVSTAILNALRQRGVGDALVLVNRVAVFEKIVGIFFLSLTCVLSLHGPMLFSVAYIPPFILQVQYPFHGFSAFIPKAITFNACGIKHILASVWNLRE